MEKCSLRSKVIDNEGEERWIRCLFGICLIIEIYLCKV